jgi:hypothetical protein
VPGGAGESGAAVRIGAPVAGAVVMGAVEGGVAMGPDVGMALGADAAWAAVEVVGATSAAAPAPELAAAPPGSTPVAAAFGPCAPVVTSDSAGAESFAP